MKLKLIEKEGEKAVCLESFLSTRWNRNPPHFDEVAIMCNKLLFIHYSNNNPDIARRVRANYLAYILCMGWSLKQRDVPVDTLIKFRDIWDAWGNTKAMRVGELYIKGCELTTIRRGTKRYAKMAEQVGKIYNDLLRGALFRVFDSPGKMEESLEDVNQILNLFVNSNHSFYGRDRVLNGWVATIFDSAFSNPVQKEAFLKWE